MESLDLHTCWACLAASSVLLVSVGVYDVGGRGEVKGEGTM